MPRGPEHADGPLDRHRRFTWPDTMWSVVRAGGQVPGLYLSHDSAERSMMASAPEFGCFVRVLLTVRLDDGGSMTYGTWLSVAEDDMLRAFEVWHDPQYADLVLLGGLANDVPPGGVLGAAARAVVGDVESTPFIDESTDSVLSRLLVEVWPTGLHADP